MLEGLESIDWSRHSHAYGVADDVPHSLRQLASRDAGERNNGYYALWGSIYHQGSVYDASLAAVPFLVELATSAEVEERERVLELLIGLSRGYADDDTPARIRGALAADLPRLERLFDEEPPLRVACAQLLGAIGDPAGALVVERRLALETDETVQLALELALGRTPRAIALLGEPGGAERLQRAYGDPDARGPFVEIFEDAALLANADLLESALRAARSQDLAFRSAMFLLDRAFPVPRPGITAADLTPLESALLRVVARLPLAWLVGNTAFAVTNALGKQDLWERDDLLRWLGIVEPLRFAVLTPSQFPRAAERCPKEWLDTPFVFFEERGEPALMAALPDGIGELAEEEMERAVPTAELLFRNGVEPWAPEVASWTLLPGLPVDEAARICTALEWKAAELGAFDDREGPSDEHAPEGVDLPSLDAGFGGPRPPELEAAVERFVELLAQGGWVETKAYHASRRTLLDGGVEVIPDALGRRFFEGGSAEARLHLHSAGALATAREACGLELPATSLEISVADASGVTALRLFFPPEQTARIAEQLVSAGALTPSTIARTFIAPLMPHLDALLLRAGEHRFLLIHQ